MNNSPLSEIQEDELLQNTPNWSLSREGIHAISKKWRFKNFKDAMVFVNNVSVIAEEEQHHPDITISYNKVLLVLTSHEVQGLTEKDFLIANRIDDLRR